MNSDWDEETIEPGPGVYGSIGVHIDEEEKEMLLEDDDFNYLLENGRVSFYAHEVWFFEGDTEAEEILEGFVCLDAL